MARSSLVGCRGVTITLHLPQDRRHHLIQAAWRVNRPQFLAFWAAGTVIVSYAALQLAHSWQVRHTIDPLLYGVIALGLIQLALPSGTILRYRWRLSRLPMEACTITINEERVFIESPSVNGDYTWSLITSVLESRDTFILRQGRLVRSVLPKAEFVAPDLTAFRRFLAERSRPARS